MSRISRLDIAIIGAGPAGLAAAVSAREQGCRNLLVFERDSEAGGILPQCIHNGFGLHYFQEELTGPEYAARFVAKARDLDIPVKLNTMVISLEPAADQKEEWLITTVSPEDGLCQYSCRAVILAMGCRERPRGAIGIPGTRCAGIMTTGTAQKLVNRQGLIPGRRIVILGSGDIGLIMARRMTYEGAQVLACVEIMPFSSGLTRNVVQCLHDYEIPLLLNHTVTKVEGRDRLTGLILSEVDPVTRKPLAGTEKRLECDTLLLSVGLIPENELSRQAGVSIDQTTMGPEVDQNLATDKPGIFACGNVLHVHDLVDFVSEESDRAGRAAWHYCQHSTKASKDLPDFVQVQVIAGSRVRGLVPQRLDQDYRSSDLTISFRPDQVYKQAYVKIYFNDQLIIRQKKQILTPGEMVSIRISKAKLGAGIKGNVLVAIEDE